MKPDVLVVSPPYPTRQSDLFAHEAFEFVERRRAEYDTTRKQLIPYVLISCGSKLLGYRRAGTTGEHRLAARASLGWGGHIEQVDARGAAVVTIEHLIRNCAKRELDEELGLGDPDRRTFVGMINDDSDEVGKVHLAYVELWTYSANAVRDVEKKAEQHTAADVFWIDPRESMATLSLESWSIRALELLDESNTEGS